MGGSDQRSDRLETDRYRLLLDTVANVIVGLRPDHTIFEWNRAAERLFGIPRAVAMGKDYVAMVLPEAHRASVRADAAKVLAGAPTQGFENDVLLPDGSRRTLLWNVTRLVGEDGEPEGILATGQDLTERIEAERRSRLVFERSADGILLLRAPSGAVECNPAALAMLGLGTADELRGRHVAEFSPPLQPDGTPSAIKAEQMDAIAMATGFHRFEWLHQDVHGAPLPVEVSLGYLGRDRGEPLFLVTWHDLRPRRRAEAERAALEMRLRHAERLELLGRFAGGIAHDFNNLLTVVDGNVSFLRDALACALPTEHEARGFVEEIAEVAGRARSLVAQVLAFSRKPSVIAEPVVLASVVSNTEKLLRRVIGEEIALTVVLADASVSVRVDPLQLEQVLLNLAVNARDAMLTQEGGRSARGGLLSLEVDQIDLDGADAASWEDIRPGRWARLRARDTGHGMTPDVLARAFDPYFTTKEVGQGTGLGLSTVHGIVRQAGGAVRAESAPGLGTTVSILFPIAEPVAARASAAAPAVQRATRPLRVLLVEDDPTVRAIAKRTLERGGHRVDEAENGAVALAQWRAAGRPHDLIVTDVRMPRMGGVELAAAMAEEVPDVPVLFMTGYAEGGVPEGVTRRSTVLSKPFGANDLLDAVAQLVVAETRG